MPTLHEIADFMKSPAGNYLSGLVVGVLIGMGLQANSEVKQLLQELKQSRRNRGH